jgi:hypothetical protein
LIGTKAVLNTAALLVKTKPNYQGLKTDDKLVAQAGCRYGREVVHQDHRSAPDKPGGEPIDVCEETT